ncbi:hypothetical protein H2201_001227 [Coniosporium apollinis]|uniref:C2H2 type master regulator of conidiophore development brlA n=2 Tax=Coniosporium TaxID=2810619 RepID=A0ABQ9P1Z4_9PEZI|nr:hypothetical protein H2199_001638 [Cladosporium sp. JES 115]KAJ9668585.1 hypothetical protein H2201_001227 [Coniosporium apollinis]
MNTPSPITPTYNFDQQNVSPVFPTNAGFSPSTKEPLAAYPPPHPHHGGPLPYPTSDIPLTVYAPPLVPQSQPTQPTPAQAAKPQSKKNQYPCPMAKQFNCSDYFTTSGHAARHAKKHTGKKDAFCPECNKAFTRKDNMEQHRRTHQSGRNAGKGAEESRAKKAKHSPQSKRPKPAPLQAAPLNVLDPSLPISPTSSFGAPAVQPYVSEYMQTSPYSETFPYPPYHMSPSFAHGLETLAIAASGEKRKFEAS